MLVSIEAEQLPAKERGLPKARATAKRLTQARDG